VTVAVRLEQQAWLCRNGLGPATLGWLSKAVTNNKNNRYQLGTAPLDLL
jgi:hypothetical protein